MKVEKLGMLTLALAALAMAGCTRSLEVKYAGGFDQTSSVKATSQQKVTVLPFKDERAWVDETNEQSRSYVGKQGAWKFGLTVDGKEFIAISSLLQTLFVSEFKSAGYDAVAGVTPSRTDGYNLTGRIVNFEFENETGIFTITSRRVVTLALSLTDGSGKVILDNQLFSENDRENEGMGVLHATNADKLMNRALKKVVTDVLVRFKSQLASRGDVLFHVTLNGVPVFLDSQTLVALARGSR